MLFDKDEDGVIAFPELIMVMKSLGQRPNSKWIHSFYLYHVWIHTCICTSITGRVAHKKQNVGKLGIWLENCFACLWHILNFSFSFFLEKKKKNSSSSAFQATFTEYKFCHLTINNLYIMFGMCSFLCNIHFTKLFRFQMTNCWNNCVRCQQMQFMILLSLMNSSKWCQSSNWKFYPKTPSRMPSVFSTKMMMA